MNRQSAARIENQCISIPELQNIKIRLLQAFHVENSSFALCAAGIGTGYKGYRKLTKNGEKCDIKEA